jgi:hypothetical protein
MVCQEQVGLIIGFLGLWYASTRGWKRTGLWIAAIGFAVSTIDFTVVIRHFSGGTPYSGRYAAVGGSLGGMVRTLLQDPIRFVHALQVSDLLGPVLLVVPVLGLCLLSPILIVALPQALLLTLSGNEADWRYNAQNVLVIIPFVYAATVLALAKREARPGTRPQLRAEHVFTLSAVIAVALGPSPLSVPNRDVSHVAAERRAVSLVPNKASVSATNHLGSHLAARRYIYVFPELARAEWIVVDSADPFLPPADFLARRRGIQVASHDLYRQPVRLARIIRALEVDPRWTQVYSRSTIHVFKRRTPVKTDER